MEMWSTKSKLSLSGRKKAPRPEMADTDGGAGVKENITRIEELGRSQAQQGRVISIPRTTLEKKRTEKKKDPRKKMSLRTVE